MDRVVHITVLAENSVGRRGLLAEHGLALWIEMDDRHLLFDTGQGAVLMHNAEQLDAHLERADAVVLSHGHYDHAGGLEHVLPVAPRAGVYAHPAAFDQKYLRYDDGTSRDIGVPPSSQRALHGHAGSLIQTEQPTEILPGLFVTGAIPRRTSYEDTGGPFFSDAECQVADPLLDDQALFFASRRGTVVLLGCAHAGVVNTLYHIREVTDGRPFHAVMGGMHLVRATRDRMARTIAALRELGVERLGPAHCTGWAATAELWNAFPEQCFPCTVGTKLGFEAE